MFIAQLKKHQEMNEQLEKLKVELLPLEQQRLKLDEMTTRRTNILLWSGLGGTYVYIFLWL